MSILTDVEEKALELSKLERGQLASKLIASLGSPFDDEDRDVMEMALQRDREMDENPENVMSEEEFWSSIDEHRRR